MAVRRARKHGVVRNWHRVRLPSVSGNEIFCLAFDDPLVHYVMLVAGLEEAIKSIRSLQCDEMRNCIHTWTVHDDMSYH